MPHSHDTGIGERDDIFVHMSKNDVNGLSSRESHDHGMDLKNGEKHDLGLQQNYGQKEMPNDTQNDEDVLVYSKLEDGMSSYLENNYGFDQDTTESNDLKLQLSDGNVELQDLFESHDFNGDLQLHMDQSQEMDTVPTQQDVFFAPVLQSRVIPTPDYELHVGQEFPDAKSFRMALRDIAIALRFEIQTVKSDKTRFTAKCASEGCPWRIYASNLRDGTTFTIKTLNNSHTCGGIAHLGHQQATVQWVASSVEQRLKENLNRSPKEIIEMIHRAHGITLSYKQAWRVKERILASVRESFKDDFRLLPQYCDQIRQTNPGSIATVYANPEDGCFQRLFVSFHASITGFLKGCSLLIGLDRAFLKSKNLGTLLLASSFDGDGALFPLAFGVVDEENEANWMWFLSELHNLLESNTEKLPKLTVLSYRQKGTVEAVDAYFPQAFHGFCVHHLAESFSIVCNNKSLVDLLWEAARALTEAGFESKVLEIEDTSPDAADWIRCIDRHLWATAYFKGTRFGHLRSNIPDSLNAWILETETFPIVQMMEHIRRKLMTWFNERREASIQWTSLLVPTAEKQVTKSIESACSYQLFCSDENEFEVVSHEGSHVVDIKNRNRQCSCNGWQMLGLPCSHAVSALLSCGLNVHRFAEACFTVASYRNVYSDTIHPIPDKSLWGDANRFVEIVMNPPKSLRPPLQQKKRARIRGEKEGCEKRVVHCSRCHQTGHFRTTCVTPI